MYKHARALGKSADHPSKKPPPRPFWRRFYYPVTRKGVGKFRQRYGKEAPAWLLAEVENFSPEKWLSYWSQKTGSRKAKPRVLS